MELIEQLNGHAYFWVGDAKVARFPISLYAVDGLTLIQSLLQENITDPVYTKLTIETGAVTYECSISASAN